MKRSLLAVMLTGLPVLVPLPVLENVNLEQLKQKTGSGEAKAQLELGYRYFQGNETTRDLTQAMGWFHRVAKQGYTPAEYVLGLRYTNGEGVPQDYAQTVVWYKKAAPKGLPQAQQSLGVMYHEGNDVKVDKAESVKWFRLTVERGRNSGQ